MQFDYGLAPLEVKEVSRLGSPRRQGVGNRDVLFGEEWRGFDTIYIHLYTTRGKDERIPLETPRP